MREDGVVTPVLPIARALDRVISALEQAGVEVVPFEMLPGEQADAWRITVSPGVTLWVYAWCLVTQLTRA
jgi:hypothetical protein